MLGNLFSPKEQETEEHWVSISDVMTGLMVIFLFIAIGYMLDVSLQKNKIEGLLEAYKNWQNALYKELHAEFEGQPKEKKRFRDKWNGRLDRETLVIRFQKPFAQGSATVPENFKDILRDFVPRYIAILTKPEYKDRISEIRIEGHTSSEWVAQVTGDESYINNMELSQDRARHVLSYVLKMKDSRVTQNRAWLKKKLTANGLSSSQINLNLSTNLQRPANTYHIVAKETGIPKQKVEKLYRTVCQEIRNWQGSESEKITSDILMGLIISSDFKTEALEFKIETLERAVGLLMEDKEDSRRVEFRVVTKSEKLIDEIEALMERFDSSEVTY